ncbi:MAG: hypothetical protein AYK19_08465 [Theionarchaea archaeon DG-70-1]|nr:MAG: hypothetical protein AYK19_08465 [Theionarchaea archaeon DG-70-1]
MDDLRQLLRYEIPGLITIIYFLMLSYPILPECANRFGICFEQVVEECIAGDILLGLSAIIVALALPIGFFLYQLYTTFDYKGFLEARKGIENTEKNIVTQILQKYLSLENKDIDHKKEWPFLAKELKWWKNHRCPSERNEILDISFYYEKKEKDLADILERFITYYHSGRVIGIYAPLVASLATIFLFVYLFPQPSTSFSQNEILVSIGNIIVFAVILILKKYKCQCFFDWLDFCKFTAIIIIIGIIILSIPDLRFLFFPFIILAISLAIIKPTYENGLLKKQIDELETNILLLKREEISKIIRAKMILEESEDPSSCKGINTFE